MSQTEDDFDAGFDMEEAEAPEAVVQEQAVPKDNGIEQAASENVAPVAPETQEPVQPELPAQPEPPAQPEKPARIAEAPETIAVELSRLRELNPAAWELALEDSAEGAAIRSRLEHFGAETAQDRAEMTLWRRNQEQQIAAAQQQQVAAYNRGFMETIRREAPDFYAMSNDPARKAEAAQYLQNLNAWIENKPFKEGVKLSQIRERGTAQEVCAMIRQFETEKSGRKSDAADMYAVPGRGAPVGPAGLGDKNDFDAGWNLHQ